MSDRTALLIGATGLVGGLCLRRLLEGDSYRQVIVLGRKPLAIQHPKLTTRIVDFARRETFENLTQADDVFCCIGTTRAQVASEEAYRKIDFDIPIHVAEFSLQRGATQFLIVSSVGADPRSGVFYSRLKGEIEEALSRMPFNAVHIFRPSMLLGDRDQSRPMESAIVRVAPLFSWMLAGPLRKYKPIHASVVAKAMVQAARSDVLGTQIYEFDRIQALGA